jgi:alpha-L-arabinofuranosidase
MIRLKDNKKQQKINDLGKDSREDYLKDLTEMMLASNIPFSKVNNPVFEAFMAKYAQQRPVDRTTLTKRLLPACYQEVTTITIHIQNNHFSFHCVRVPCAMCYVHNIMYHANAMNILGAE